MTPPRDMPGGCHPERNMHNYHNVLLRIEIDVSSRTRAQAKREMSICYLEILDRENRDTYIGFPASSTDFHGAGGRGGRAARG